MLGILWPLVLSQWEILIIDPWEIDKTTHCPILPSDGKYLPVLGLLKPFHVLEFGCHSLGRGGFKEALSWMVQVQGGHLAVSILYFVSNVPHWSHPSPGFERNPTLSESSEI